MFEYGSYVRSERERMGFSLAKLAKLTGFSIQYLRGIEAEGDDRTTLPSRKRSDAIASALSLDPDHLWYVRCRDKTPSEVLARLDELERWVSGFGPTFWEESPNLRLLREAFEEIEKDCGPPQPRFPGDPQPVIPFRFKGEAAYSFLNLVQAVRGDLAPQFMAMLATFSYLPEASHRHVVELMCVAVKAVAATVAETYRPRAEPPWVWNGRYPPSREGAADPKDDTHADITRGETPTAVDPT